jgi:hypothetical protein
VARSRQSTGESTNGTYQQGVEKTLSTQLSRYCPTGRLSALFDTHLRPVRDHDVREVAMSGGAVEFLPSVSLLRSTQTFNPWAIDEIRDVAALSRPGNIATIAVCGIGGDPLVEALQLRKRPASPGIHAATIPMSQTR